MNMNNPMLAAITQAVSVSDPFPCDLSCSVPREVLLRALKQVVKATDSRREVPPILSHILLVAHKDAGSDQLLLATTNLSTSICFQLDAGVRVEREGAFTIQAKPLLRLVKTFHKGSHLSIEVQDTRVLLTCATLTLSLKGGHPACEFPLLLTVGLHPLCVLGSNVLRQAIGEVQYAAEDGHYQPDLGAICLSVKEHQVDLMACDGHTLAKRTIPLSADAFSSAATVLARVGAIYHLMEILPADGEVRIVWDKILSRILFQAGPVCLVTPLINETPRDYARAIPSSFTTTFDLAHHEVLQMLKAFVPFCRNSILKLCYHGSGVVKFEAESEEFDGECVLETDVSGQDGEMLLNMRLLANILNNVEAPSLTISVAGPTDPVLIVPTGRTDYVSVLMPMSRL